MKEKKRKKEEREKGHENGVHKNKAKQIIF
jgi:hypothetical protein